MYPFFSPLSCYEIDWIDEQAKRSAEHAHLMIKGPEHPETQGLLKTWDYRTRNKSQYHLLTEPNAARRKELSVWLTEQWICAICASIDRQILENGSDAQYKSTSVSIRFASLSVGQGYSARLPIKLFFTNCTVLIIGIGASVMEKLSICSKEPCQNSL